ncbi:hypothetical protein KJ652_00775 [Patescibacteria group bacterium]|nr:hypothetical protein [Patescibacteria group bacterium]MBU1123104.1 hypothetical protein [Patescibacteria group bacterium]MBU1911770.1 hypothetical protein [Patescibacteria group bacterium]
MHFSRLLRYVFWLIIVLATLKGAYHLFAQAWYLFNGAHAGDANYYWTVGRGVLNDLKLYTDIFEGRPPIIFLLSSISIWLTGNAALGYWINSFIVLLTPAMFGVALFYMCRDLLRHDKYLYIILGLLFGVTLALFSAFQAEGWQSEFFGSFFGIFYVTMIIILPNRNRIYDTLILALCMFFSIGFKEPYVLVLLAAALVLARDFRHFKRIFLIPVVIVGITGLIALFVMGYADGYLSTYLHSLFGQKIMSTVPLWRRGLMFTILLFSQVQFSYLFSALITLLLALVCIRQRPTLIKNSYAKYLILPIALYLSLTAANMRGYYTSNHFVAMTPFYAAIFIVFIKSTIHRFNTNLTISGIVVTLLISFTLIMLPLSDGFPAYAKKLDAMKESEANIIQIAESIDNILDACDIDRYFFTGNKDYMPYTKHSPLNFYVYTGPAGIISHHPLLVNKQLEAFSRSKIVIVPGNSYQVNQRPEVKALSQLIKRYLDEHFTSKPAECAASLPSPEGYSMLFRKDPEKIVPFPFKVVPQ